VDCCVSLLFIRALQNFARASGYEIFRHAVAPGLTPRSHTLPFNCFAIFPTHAAKTAYILHLNVRHIERIE
jgi:hypothetical protein